MGLLENLEQRLDRIVNGSFSKAFKSEVQPVELGAALQQEIDNLIVQMKNSEEKARKAMGDAGTFFSLFFYA